MARMPSVVAEARPSLNGFGRGVVEVSFAHTLSESDDRPQYSLQARWASIRRAARKALVDFIAEREQTTSETFEQAQARIRASMPPLEVRAQDVDAQNAWHGVTFAEPE